MNRTIKLGIRQLVEFCCRSGDLGFDSGPGPSAQEGLRTHQKIQKRYQDEALAEYRLKFQIQLNDFNVELGGRIDLLFENEIPPRVEEIKTVYSLLDSELDNDDAPHWAQVKSYAAVYALQQNIEAVIISLNYVSLFNHQENRKTRLLTKHELEAFLRQTLSQYLQWHQLVSGLHEETISTARNLVFPHDSFRQQQHHFASQVYRNIQRQKSAYDRSPNRLRKNNQHPVPFSKSHR